LSPNHPAAPSLPETAYPLPFRRGKKASPENGTARQGKDTTEEAWDFAREKEKKAVVQEKGALPVSFSIFLFVVIIFMPKYIYSGGEIMVRFFT
jgi:hypothetical protein